MLLVRNIRLPLTWLSEANQPALKKSLEHAGLC